MVLIFAIGFYDGFLGPGTGSFLMFAFLMIGFKRGSGYVRALFIAVTFILLAKNIHDLINLHSLP